MYIGKEGRVEMGIEGEGRGNGERKSKKRETVKD